MSSSLICIEGDAEYVEEEEEEEETEEENAEEDDSEEERGLREKRD